jgi:hypothetical protein
MIDLRPYSHDDLPEIRQTLIDVHADAYADQMDRKVGERQPFPDSPVYAVMLRRL